MPPKKGGNQNKNNKNKNQKSDSDDDWTPTDVFGNPMPVVDTSGWDELKTFDQAKRQGGVAARSDQKRQQRQQQQSQNDKQKNNNNKTQQQSSNQQSRRPQVNNNDNDDDHTHNNKGSVYHDHDGVNTISQRERSRSRSQSRSNRQNQQNPPNHKQNKSTSHHNDHPKSIKPPKVFKPTSITLTSFENKDRSVNDASAGSQPITVRTIFAKQTQEEKDEQRKLTLLQLPTYSNTTGSFLPQNINTLTPGYIPGHGQPTTASTTATANYSMPISPLYQKFHISFPHRPNIPNPKALTPQRYKEVEEQTFHKWLEAIYTKFTPQQLNHFEHNLYVWKQLWLCCESSDVILIIIDVRNPLFHFNSHLYHYIVHELKKPFVLVLNKIDLIPISVSLGFKKYLETTFPGVHVVLFSSYPSTLHSLVLSLQHYNTEQVETKSQHPNPAQIDEKDGNITMDSLIRHEIDLTPADIANHQRTVVNRMKMANIIDTVGVDELLQLCLHLTKGHSYKPHGPSDQTTTINNNQQGKNTPQQTHDDSTEQRLNDEDIHGRRILSQREQLKWQAKQTKHQFQQGILKEHLQNFISHADKRSKEQQAEQRPVIDGLNDEMEELTLTSRSQSSKHTSTSYFKDTDIVDVQSEGDNDDYHSGSDGDDDEDDNGVKSKNKNKTHSLGRDNTPNSHQFSIESKVGRLNPPSIGGKGMNHKHETDSSEEELESGLDSSLSSCDEDQEPDYEHLDTYMPELSMTEDEIEAVQLSHIVQDSPALTSSRTNSPSVSSTAGKGPSKPVFDLQRVLQHIYTQEENSRETHNKTKESLRKFKSSQQEIGQYYSDSDDNIDQLEKEHKKHQKQQPLTKAQLKEQERQHLEYIRHNRIKIGFVGHPNVGKSSVVNAISRKKTVSVSRQPGHTKYNQTIKINELITLIDCPGLIFPALDNNQISSTLFGLYPIPQVSQPVVVIYYLAQMIDLVTILGLNNYHPLRYEPQEQEDDNNNKIPQTQQLDIKTMDDLLNMKLPNQGQKQQHQLASTTVGDDDVNTDNNGGDIGYGWTALTICEAFATKRGFMTSKATPDPQRAAQQILYLIADGKIQLYMLPPTAATHDQQQ
jgi:ribosome biogenesis GTPase A